MKAPPGFLALVLLFGFGGAALDASAVCTPGSAVPSVTICSPGSTSGTSVHVTAAAKASLPITYMAVWMDGVKKYQNHSSSLDTYVTASAGSHRVTVQAKDSSGTMYSAKVYTTVSTTTATWSASGAVSPAATGVKMTLTGTKSASTTTSTNGTFSFSGLANGTYTITPSATNMSFSPTSKTVTVNGASVSGITFAGTVNSGHSVSLNWNASTTSSVSGYKVYRSMVSGGPYSLLNGNPVTSTIYSDLNVSGGSTYFYVVTAVDSSGHESSHSSQVKATIPTP